MKNNPAQEYESLPCPSCNAKPPCLEMHGSMSMLFCSQCGAVVQENVVASGDANLQWDSYKHGWRPHGVILKSSQSGGDVARAMLYVDKQKRNPFYNFVSVSDAEKATTSSSSLANGTEVCQAPLANLASKLKLPDNTKYEAECLFHDVFSKTAIFNEFGNFADASASASRSGVDTLLGSGGKGTALAVVVSRDAPASSPERNGNGNGKEILLSTGGASTSTALVPCSPSALPSCPTPLDSTSGVPEKITTQEAEILVGACVYAACRLQHVPILLEDIANAINCDKNVLYHMSKEMRDTMGLELPVLDLDQLLRTSLSSLQKEYPKEVLDADALLTQSVSLLQFCKSQYISDGKHPMGLMAAIIYLVIKNTCPIRESSVVTRCFSMEEIAEVLRCKVSTMSSRVTEICAKFKELKENFLGSASGYHVFPCLPSKENWNDFAWDKTSEVPDKFVMQWISQLQIEGDVQRKRMMMGSVEHSKVNEEGEERLRQINALLIASVASSASGKKRKANSSLVERAKQHSKVLKHVSKRSEQWKHCFVSLGKRSTKQQNQKKLKDSKSSRKKQKGKGKGKGSSGSSSTSAAGREIVTYKKSKAAAAQDLFSEMGNAVSRYFFPATSQKLILGYTFNDKKPMTPEDLESTFEDIQRTQVLSNHQDQVEP